MAASSTSSKGWMRPLLAGDTCLKHVVGIIQRNIREGDWLARWGEVEFVLAFHEAEKESSVRAILSGWVRTSARTQRGCRMGEELHLTFSSGACRYTGGHADTQRLLSSANEVLYQAKEGRRLVVHNAYGASANA
jgi:diguanylate cyclase (GGDEF)-like protein